MRTPVLVRSVDRFVRQATGPVSGVVVAVSGGPDSVALARALAELRPSFADCPLVLAHLNHRLRGADSDADEAFVLELARTIGVEAVTARVDVNAEVAAGGGNVEAVARRVRYDWLADVARRRGLTRVATGHTADDQAETVLHRLLRGTGLQGLRGVAARRPLSDGVGLERPLLRVRRADVLLYLESLGQPSRHDATNDDRAFTRNRIRHELLPLLSREYNPAVVSVLSRLAEQAAEAFDDEEARAAALAAAAERPRAGAVLVFGREPLLAAPSPLLRAMFRHLWRRENWPAGAMTHEHWERLVDLTRGGRSAVDFPAGVRAVSTGRILRLTRDVPRNVRPAGDTAPAGGYHPNEP